MTLLGLEGRLRPPNQDVQLLPQEDKHLGHRQMAQPEARQRWSLAAKNSGSSCSASIGVTDDWVAKASAASRLTSASAPGIKGGGGKQGGTRRARMEWDKKRDRRAASAPNRASSTGASAVDTRTDWSGKGLPSLAS